MKNLFTISSEDVQYVAKKKLCRKLTTDELYQVQRGIEFGLECWEKIVSMQLNNYRIIF